MVETERATRIGEIMSSEEINDRALMRVGCPENRVDAEVLTAFSHPDGGENTSNDGCAFRVNDAHENYRIPRRWV